MSAEVLTQAIDPASDRAVYKLTGTLMAHRGLGGDHRLEFSYVELGGLEPPTPCLQNRRRLSDVVAHLGIWS